MNIVSIREHLLNALPSLARIASQSTSLPILSSVKIEAKNGRLFLRATNLEVGLIISMRCAISEEGSVVIPARLFQSVMEGVAEKKVGIKKKKTGTINITTKTCSTEIKGVESGDFPLIPKLGAKPVFKISAERIVGAIKQVLPSVAVSNMRPDLAGVYMSFNGDELSVVATDGFRLGEKIVSLGGEPLKERLSFILPGRTAVEVVRIFGNTKEDLSVVVEDGQIALITQDVYLVSRLIDGNYPDYAQIIPKKHKIEAVFKKEDLARAIKLASVFSERDANDVTLTLEDKLNNIKVEAQSKEAGQLAKNISANIKGASIKIILNHRYLMDGLSSLSGETVCLLIETDSSPVMLKTEKGEDDFVYIISPIKK